MSCPNTVCKDICDTRLRNKALDVKRVESLRDHTIMRDYGDIYCVLVPLLRIENYLNIVSELLRCNVLLISIVRDDIFKFALLMKFMLNEFAQRLITHALFDPVELVARIEVAMPQITEFDKTYCAALCGLSRELYGI